MDGYYIGLLIGLGYIGYKEHKQLCKLETDMKDLKILLNQQTIKQEKIHLSLKDIFD